MNGSDRRIRGLYEVSIRVNDLAAMCAFYEDVVGLKVLRREESYVFFEIAEDTGAFAEPRALRRRRADAPATEVRDAQLESVDAASHRPEHRPRGL